MKIPFRALHAIEVTPSLICKNYVFGKEKQILRRMKKIKNKKIMNMEIATNFEAVK